MYAQLNMLMIQHDFEKGFSHDKSWLRNLLKSSAVHVQAWLGFWGVNQQCTAGNDRFHVARGLWPIALFVWRVVLGREVLAQLAAVPLPLWPDGWVLFGPHQPGRLASRRLQRKRWRKGGCDRGEELLAEHLGARPGLLPAAEKTSPLTPQSSRLCGDRDLSLHLHGQHRPIMICLSMNGHAHKISFFFSPIPFFWQQISFWYDYYYCNPQCDLTQYYVQPHICTFAPQSKTSVTHFVFGSLLSGI